LAYVLGRMGRLAQKVGTLTVEEEARMKNRQVLDQVSAELQADPKWREFASRVMPQGPMVEWIKANRPDIAKGLSRLSAKECLAEGFIAAVVAFGGLMAD